MKFHAKYYRELGQETRIGLELHSTIVSAINSRYTNKREKPTRKCVRCLMVLSFLHE